MDARRWIREEPLNLEALLDETDDVRCGALQIFAGTVRDSNDGRRVLSMTYEAHRGLAARTLEKLERETKQRFDVPVCRIQHRTGHLALGEVSVYVVVRAPHRASAFEAARYAIDMLKRVTPIWKHEHYADGDSQYLDGTPLRVEPASEPSPDSGSRP